MKTAPINRPEDGQSAYSGSALLDWLLEAAILFGLAFLLGPFLVTWGQDFDITFRASVYWIPVLLLAVQHGLPGGLAATLVATALYVQETASGVQVGETLLAYSLRVGFEPLVWTVVAAVFGAIRSRSTEAEARLRKDLATETNTVEILAERYIRLRDRIENLERSMATGTAPPLRQSGQLLDRLATLDAPTCVSRLYQVLTAAANGAHVTVYAIQGSTSLPILPSEAPVARTPELPPAITFPIRDARARAIMEVHVGRVDPELFSQTDQSHFMELCDRIGSLLEQRGIEDLVRLARSREVA